MRHRPGSHAVAGAIVALAAIVLPTLSCSAAPPVSSGAESIRATSSMSEPRAAHTATALADGDVLIVGGFGGDEAHPGGAELFHPADERFERIDPPGDRRQSHTATRLADGRVLIAGGLGAGNTALATAELYDPATRTFAPTGRLVTARSNHEAVLLDDGRVLLVGGAGAGWTFLAGCEIYDPATGTFAAAAAMAEPREGHAAIRLQDGRVLVLGGHRGRGSATVISRTAEIYDVAANRFSPTGAMTVRRHKHDALALAHGRVLVLGGADERDNEGVYASTEVFDPARGVFQAGRPMRAGRYKHRGTSFLREDGHVLLTGGAARAEEYDPATGQGTFVAGSARMAGQFSAAALLPGGGVLVTGGYGQGRGPRNSAWIVDAAPADRP